LDLTLPFPAAFFGKEGPCLAPRGDGRAGQAPAPDRGEFLERLTTVPGRLRRPVDEIAVVEFSCTIGKQLE